MGLLIGPLCAPTCPWGIPWLVCMLLLVLLWLCYIGSAIRTKCRARYASFAHIIVHTMPCVRGKDMQYTTASRLMTIS